MDDQQIVYLVKIINQLFDLEKKLKSKQEVSSIRNIDRIKENFVEMGIIIHDPIGESFSETRTDCEANIAGSISDKMVISEVIKPIIYKAESNQTKIIIQRGVVIVESK